MKLYNFKIRIWSNLKKNHISLELFFQYVKKERITNYSAIKLKELVFLFEDSKLSVILLRTKYSQIFSIQSFINNSPDFFHFQALTFFATDVKIANCFLMDKGIFHPPRYSKALTL